MGMRRRERVEKALRFKGPDKTPLLYFNCDRSDSDIIVVEVVRHFLGPNSDRSEWGFEWSRSDETMGQPKSPVLSDIGEIDALGVPDAKDPERFSGVEKEMKRFGPDRYYLASLVLTGFTIMTFLRGFSEVLEELYLERVRMEELADRVFGFEEEVIRELAGKGFDGVAFYDDWGTQEGMIGSPDLWRDFFKPRYRRQFALAHECGLDVYFHSCGYYYEIIEDLLEIGVDMLNISQPNLYDMRRLGSDFGGRVCFVCPVSYQTTSISGTRNEIFESVRELVKNLGSYSGGLIGYVEWYESIGLREENYLSCIEAFRSISPRVS